MTLKNPGAQEKQYNLDNLFGQGSFFPNTDWSRTQAYAVGLGQMYLNLRGREKYGIVKPGPEADRILDGPAPEVAGPRGPGHPREGD